MELPIRPGSPLPAQRFAEGHLPRQAGKGTGATFRGKRGREAGKARLGKRVTTKPDGRYLIYYEKVGA